MSQSDGIKKISHFIWDVDGTLLDSYPAMVESMRSALLELGVEAKSEEIYTQMMDSVPECIARYSAEHGLEGLTELFRLHNRKNGAENTPPMSGAIECCEAIIAGGGFNYIVTNRSKTTFPLLEAYDMTRLFREIITVDMGFTRKPDKAATVHILEKYKINPDAAAYVGDRDLDVVTGRNAGIKTIRLAENPLYVHETADFTVGSLAELLTLL